MAQPHAQLHHINETALAQQQSARVSSAQRFQNRRYTPRLSWWRLVGWLLYRKRYLPAAQNFPLTTANHSKILGAPPAQPQLLWLGHASFLLRYGDNAVLTDPVFSHRASPFKRLGPERSTPVALTVEELPAITHVFISHNHYDHLDKASVQALHQRFGTAVTWWVPQGLKAWFARLGIQQVHELGWWEKETHSSGVVGCFVPAQHFSGRGLFDSNRTLWGGWVIDLPGFRCFFAGDTGYEEDLFKDIGAVFPHIDVALLPIGAYDPRALMFSMHVNPEEAVQMHLDLAPRRSVGMHWGSFQLTDEPMSEPPDRLRHACAQRGVSSDDFVVMQHGDVLTFAVSQSE